MMMVYSKVALLVMIFMLLISTGYAACCMHSSLYHVDIFLMIVMFLMLLDHVKATNDGGSDGIKLPVFGSNIKFKVW